jgi:hypothetical protein
MTDDASNSEVSEAISEWAEDAECRDYRRPCTNFCIHYRTRIIRISVDRLTLGPA